VAVAFEFGGIVFEAISRCGPARRHDIYVCGIGSRCVAIAPVTVLPRKQPLGID